MDKVENGSRAWVWCAGGDRLAEEEDAEVGEVVDGCDAGVERSAAKLVEQARV